jgi:hypothetical protein
VIVNSYEPTSKYKGNVFRTTALVLQDTERIDVWKLYNGTTDDMLVFDK